MVLADISCHSRAHACHGHGEHLANLLTGGLGGHGGAAQQVDGILHDEGTDGRNGILKAHRKADIGQPPAVPRREDTVFPGEMDALHPGEEPPGAEQAAEQLADNGGNGCALHAHTQRNDEQPVQPDVQEAGDQQEIERVLGIAQTAQNGGGVVEQHRGRNAEENDADVGHRVREQLGRGVDELQQRGSNEGGDDGEHHTQDHAEDRTIEQVLVHVLAVPCTKALGHRDAKARTGSQYKA